MLRDNLAGLIDPMRAARELNPLALFTEQKKSSYEGRVKDGGILLSVHSDASEWTKKAKEILERTGAQDISSTGEATGEKSDKPRVREVA